MFQANNLFDLNKININNTNAYTNLRKYIKKYIETNNFVFTKGVNAHTVGKIKDGDIKPRFLKFVILKGNVKVGNQEIIDECCTLSTHKYMINLDLYSEYQDDYVYKYKMYVNLSANLYDLVDNSPEFSDKINTFWSDVARNYNNIIISNLRDNMLYLSDRPIAIELSIYNYKVYDKDTIKPILLHMVEARRPGNVIGGRLNIQITKQIPQFEFIITIHL